MKVVSVESNGDECGNYSQQQICPWRNASGRSVRPLISSSDVLVQSSDFSLKMQPKLLLPPTSSHGLITVTFQKVQYFAARLILMAPHYHYSTPLLIKLHWLPIPERIKYKVACMCFHAINGSGPTYLFELLHIYTPSCTLRSSSDSHMLKIQQYKHKTHGFRTFTYLDPMFGIHSHIRQCSTLTSFKTNLKTFLFSQYFCSS